MLISSLLQFVTGLANFPVTAVLFFTLSLSSSESLVTQSPRHPWDLEQSQAQDVLRSWSAGTLSGWIVCASHGCLPPARTTSSATLEIPPEWIWSTGHVRHSTLWRGLIWVIISWRDYLAISFSYPVLGCSTLLTIRFEASHVMCLGFIDTDDLCQIVYNCITERKRERD